jgi:hypothetical protein
MNVNNKVITIGLLVLLLILPEEVYAALLKISWNKNTESNLEGYNVHIGTTPGNYDSRLNVGLNNEVYMSGLEENVDLYIAISAYNQIGIEGPFSEEVRANNPPMKRSLQDILYDQRLSTKDVFYNFSYYEPSSSMILDHPIVRIHVEIPSGATSNSFFMGVGSGGLLTPTTSQPELMTDTIDFELVPNSISLLKPALITVPFKWKNASIEQYNEVTRSWVKVSDMNTKNGTISFSTQTFGHFKINQRSENREGTCMIAASTFDNSTIIILLFLVFIGIIISNNVALKRNLSSQ